MSKKPMKLHNFVLNRRQVLGLALGASCVIPVTVHAQNNSRTLQQPIDVDLLETLMKLQLELDGEAHLSDTKEGKPRRAAIKSKSIQEYLETVAYDKRQPIAAARYYVNAKNDNWIAGRVVSHQLRSEVSDIRALLNDGIWELYSPAQPLESSEVNLLRSPINTLALEKILPTEPARADSKWLISHDDAKDLFNLDAVNQCSLVAKIAGVEKNTAKIEIEGSLDAVANSVTTRMLVRGNAHATMGSRCPLITWVGMSIKEAREISEHEPGFEVTARLQIVRQELKDKLNVTHEELAALAQQPNAGNWLVRIQSKTKFTSLASRNWIVFMDTPEDSVLRYVEKNRVIAQCNVIPLPKLEAGTQLTLQGLQEDMRTALSKDFEQFIESAERVTSNKLRLLRCEAAGKQQDVPIRWIYAHLSDDSGRRLLLTFTLAAEFAESFAGGDLQILDSLEFTSATSESAQATPPSVIK